MITRITRVAIFQTGKHLAAWYGFMSLVILLPMFLIFLAYSPENIVDTDIDFSYDALLERIDEVITRREPTETPEGDLQELQEITGT